MSAQLSLLDHVAPRLTGLDAAFAAWLERYPWVPDLVVRELRADALAGRRLSIKAIVEDMRNGRRGPMPHDGQFGWNNSYTSRLNRHVLTFWPEFSGKLEVRALKT